MRIVAMFFVIFNHTGYNGFFLFSKTESGPLFWVYLFISVFCKFAVPLYFAISGALMLGRKDEPLKVLWKKRILKIFILLVVYSLIYYVFKIYTNDGVFSWKDFFKSMYSSNIRAHLWYLYAYIAYLISLPLLRALVRNLETKYYYYMIAIALFFNGILPAWEYLIGKGEYTINSHIQVSWMISNIVLYPCIGYFMQNKLDINKIKSKLPILWIFNIIGILISAYMTYYKGEVTGVLNPSKSQDFHNNFVLLNCMAIFLTIKYVVEKKKLPEKAERLIVSVGSCTFGIYLIHVLIQGLPFAKSMLTFLQNSGLNAMLAIWIDCFCIMVISYAITFVLMKIPVLKKLVGG